MTTLDDALQTPIENAPEAQGENYLDNLVGPGKKYKDVQDLAKAYTHIEIFSNELKDELRDERKYIREMVETLRKPAHVTDEEAPAATPTPAMQSPINADDINKMVRDAVANLEQTKTVQENMQITVGKLTELYGSKDAADKAFSLIVGSNVELKNAISNLAAVDPDAAVRLITDKAPAPTGGATEVVPARDALENANAALGDGALTWAKCREIKKKNVKLYNSPEFRKRMEKAAAEAAARGTDFFRT